MRIFYGFSNCTDGLYYKLVASKNLNELRPDQKFHGLIIKGLKSNGNEVKCFSGLPINRRISKKLFIYVKNETEDGVKYNYYKTLNLPILRQLGIFFGGFFGVLFSKKKKKDTVVLCDVLNIANAYGMALAAKIRRIPVVFTVTDLPEFQYGNGVTRKIAERLFKKADGFMFLTAAMSEKVNKKNKPFIVMEGLSDSDVVPVSVGERTENLTGVKEIIYAGGVLSQYGLPELAEGFIAAGIENSVLKIYGDGDYAESVKKIAAENKNVKYMGVVPNGTVVEDEKRAALLVNPRPTTEEYTKYSFPSKNMEYMASYTPVLTTKLAGMPSEYYEYIYTVDDCSVSGIAAALKSVFSESKEKRYALGEKAGKYVKENKNNIVQTKKLSEFLETLSK